MTTEFEPDVLGFLGFVSLGAQGRLAKDSTLALNPSMQVSIARMSGLAWQGFEAVERVANELETPLDICGLMLPFQGLMEDLEARLRPEGWWERVVKTYVILGFFTDLENHLLRDFSDVSLQRIAPLPGDFGHGKWAAQSLSERLEDDPKKHDRMSLWGRRTFGDVVSTARVALRRIGSHELTEDVYASLTEQHALRMRAANLAG